MTVALLFDFVKQLQRFRVVFEQSVVVPPLRQQRIIFLGDRRRR
jgi:hypothetical protein